MTSYSEKEIEQKLEHLLHEYTSQLNFHKLKYERSTAEVIVCTTLEVVENVATLNFSKAAKTLFELKKHQLDLLEVEQQMIGKEVAYIHKANTSFG